MSPLFRGECAVVQLPLDRADPSGRTIGIAVRRLRSSRRALGQVWMLNGGPGFGGSQLVETAAWIRDQGFDAYLPDYRGTGDSERLACSPGANAQGALSDTCVGEVVDRWGDELVHFGTTDSARDIVDLVHASREPRVPVLLWGGSYGTLVAERLLHLAPDLFAATLLDSAMNPGDRAGFAGWDDSVETVARRMFDLCGRDPFCSGKLGSDPWARRVQLEQALREGHCAGVATDDVFRTLRRVLGWAVDAGPRFAVIGLSAVYRLERCDEADRRALSSLFRRVPQGEVPGRERHGPDPEEFSSLLYALVVGSELWDPEMDVERARTLEEERLATQDGVIGLAKLLEGLELPRYEVDGGYLQWARPAGPDAILQGDLDHNTNVNDVLDFPGALFVRFPYASHGVFYTSDVVRQLPDETCAQQITRSFFVGRSPGVDTSCAAASKLPDLYGWQELARAIYATTDAWENDGQGLVHVTPELQAEVDEFFARMRRPPRLLAAHPAIEPHPGGATAARSFSRAPSRAP